MSKRAVSSEDVLQYEPMVESYIRKHVVKNWNEASTSKSKGDVSLGNSGWTINDVRQYLRAEVFVALRNFNPDYVTPEGKTIKESTFVFKHLSFRIGQLMKKLTKKDRGYGVWTSNLEEVLYEFDPEQG